MSTPPVSAAPSPPAPRGPGDAALRAVAIAAAVLSLALCVLIVADYARLKSADPLNSRALQALRVRFQQDPADDALKEEIRTLDLLARRTYFTRTWQVRAGGILLLASTAACLLAWKTLLARRRLPPMPGACPGGDDRWAAAARSRRWLAGAGLFLALLCVGLAFLDRSRLAATGAQAPGAHGETAGTATAAHAPADTPPATPTGLPAEPLPLHWPGFRGPGGNGHAPADADPPIAWDVAAGSGVLWKVELPLPGFNSPVVAGNRVFLTGASAAVRELFCYDADSGALLWRQPLRGIRGSPAAPPEVTDDTGYAAPSVATDGRRVFALFANGDLAAFTVEGAPLWAQNLGTPQNHYGHSSSLVADLTRLYVQYDHGGGSRVLALHTDSGRVAWSRHRAVETSWASPILVHTGARRELVLNAAPQVVSYDPDSGEEFWALECMGGEVAPAPAYDDGLVFVANQYARLAAIETGNGTLLWDQYDLSLPDVASPLAVDGLLFLAASDGIVTCLDARGGTVHWTQEFPKGFYASPVLAGGRVYATDMGGTVHIFRAAAAYEAVGTAAVGESVVATPAPVGRRLYVRGSRHLFCFGAP
jgi:outer membrane protein assembly factor BamB